MKNNGIYNIVPNNRKSLFLRGIERLLIQMGAIEKSSVKSFRNNRANDFLQLINCYEKDVASGENIESLLKYTNDALFDRFVEDQRRLCDSFNQNLPGKRGTNINIRMEVE